MKNRFILFKSLILVFLLLPGIVYSQANSGGLPISSLTALNSDFAAADMPAFDVNQFLTEDYDNLSKPGTPFRYGKVFDVNYDLRNSGTWETLPDGSRVWRLAINSEGALSIKGCGGEVVLHKVGGSWWLIREKGEGVGEQVWRVPASGR